MRDLLYADASAIVKLLLRESESRALEERFGRETRVATSIVAKVEVARAIRRAGLSAGTEIKARGLFDRFHLVGLGERVIRDAMRLGPPVLRALDAIHLASVLSLEDDVAALITYDRRLAEAARGAGLAVETPD